VLEPPPQVKAAFRAALDDATPGRHRYMPNAGLPDVRAAVAAFLAKDFDVEIRMPMVLLCVGAGGGLNVVLKSLLDPGDEVVVLAPYFPEYRFYIDNHGGTMVPVATRPDFQPDPAALAKALTPRTAAVLVNSPNNPTGVVYEQEALDAVGQVLRTHAKRTGRVVALVSDEPYRRILFDGRKPASVFRAYGPSILVTSHSKDLAIPGERIGVVAAGPEFPDGEALMGALTFSNRVLGFVNAPALAQRAVAGLQGLSVDPEIYRAKRDRLHGALVEMGYDCVRPGGAFYLFPKAPGGDDVAFVQKLLEQRILVVPGTGFGSPGYFRVSYCVEDREIEGALKGFRDALLAGGGWLMGRS
jgi:aspartate aminotransferase